VEVEEDSVVAVDEAEPGATSAVEVVVAA